MNAKMEPVKTQDSSSTPAAAKPLSLSMSHEEAGVAALRIAGHDFKTPLTTLKTLAQIFEHAMKKGTLLANPERTARNCRILNEQVDRLVELSETLLDVARAYGGRIKVDPVPSDLRLAVRSAAVRFQNELKETVLPDCDVVGPWDVNRLERALSSFLMELVSGKLTLRTNDTEAVITIEGEFKPETSRDIPHYFIATAIVEKHGGSVRDRFEIRLPLEGVSRRLTPVSS